MKKNVLMMLEAMDDVRTLMLDPSYAFLESGFNFTFHSIHLILCYSLLPLCFRLDRIPTWHIGRTGRSTIIPMIIQPVPFPAHNAVWPMT